MKININAKNSIADKINNRKGIEMAISTIVVIVLVLVVLIVVLSFFLGSTGETFGGLSDIMTGAGEKLSELGGSAGLG